MGVPAMFLRGRGEWRSPLLHAGQGGLIPRRKHTFRDREGADFSRGTAFRIKEWGMADALRRQTVNLLMWQHCTGRYTPVLAR